MRCLAEQAKILLAEAEDNNLGVDKLQAAMDRWHTCSLCEQDYHGVVLCALGWACWKTYLGRPETDPTRIGAMRLLAGGLCGAKHYTDALSVYEAEFSMLRRLGDSESNLLAVQSNLASLYQFLGRSEEALSVRQEVYSVNLKLNGKQHGLTLIAANNYAHCLLTLRKCEEAKSLLRKTVPVARRVQREGDENTLRLRWNYARALREDDGATLDDLRKAVTTLEETAPIARRVLGISHPLALSIENYLQEAQAALRSRTE